MKKQYNLNVSCHIFALMQNKKPFAKQQKANEIGLPRRFFHRKKIFGKKEKYAVKSFAFLQAIKQDQRPCFDLWSE